MVDRGRFDLSMADGGGQQQERQTVRSPGDSDPEPCPGWNEPVELGGETAGERRIRSSWRRPCPWSQAS
jgi:hypothetical protein